MLTSITLICSSSRSTASPRTLVVLVGFHSDNISCVHDADLQLLALGGRRQRVDVLLQVASRASHLAHQARVDRSPAAPCTQTDSRGGTRLLDPTQQQTSYNLARVEHEQSHEWHDLLWRAALCDTLCTSGFTGDVMFAHDGQVQVEMTGL